MEGVDMTSTPHTIDSRDFYDHMLPSNGHVLDARRSAQTSEQFTATYDQARSFMQEAGQSIRHYIASIRRLLTHSGVTIDDITKLSDRFWEFYLNGTLRWYHTYVKKRLV